MKQRIEYISAMKTPPGSPRVSKFQEFFIELEYVEFGCDHQLLNELEAKNHKKVEENPQRVLKNIVFLHNFWLLAHLKVDGRSQTQ